MLRIVACLVIFLVSGLGAVVSQEDASNLHLYISDETLIVYVSSPDPVALNGFALRVVVGQGKFTTFKLEERFEVLQLNSGIAQPGTCLVYFQAGKRYNLPDVCSQPTKVYLVEVLLAEIFWYDFTKARPRDIAIMADDTATGIICPGRLADCPIYYLAPGTTPVPSSTPASKEFIASETPSPTVVVDPIETTSPTASCCQSPQVNVKLTRTTNKREGPGRDYMAKGSWQAGEEIAICGRNSERGEEWVRVCSDKEEQWLLRDSTRVNIDDTTFAALPEVPAPPYEQNCSAAKITSPLNATSITSNTVTVYWNARDCPMIIHAHLNDVLVWKQSNVYSGNNIVETASPGRWTIKIWYKPDNRPEEHDKIDIIKE
ncbi:MAG TPA: hypothetical protein VHO69_16230 [Phototrophicaceae bacterium]|nr:hypothetical protein [Phototrophicaceae bacterium]